MADNYFYEKVYEGLDLAGMKLTGNSYENCQFIRCDLSGAKLDQVILVECFFQECNLGNARITGATVRDCRFEHCKMIGINFSETNTVGFSAMFDSCKMDHSVFFKLSLKRSKFFFCSLVEADFTEADLEGHVFPYCDLDRAQFQWANLRDVDFREAHNVALDPGINKVDGAHFNLEQLPGLLQHFGIKVNLD